ncbi:hypothetical protein ACHAP9_004799 [Verticillium nonalfalfae]
MLSRIEKDTVGHKAVTSPLIGLKEAIVDLEDGFKNFFLTIVNTLGFDTTITLVLTCPP